MIADAVKEAVTALPSCPAIARQLKEGGDMKTIQRWVAKTVAESIATKLQYTHDNFDDKAARAFVREVQQQFEGK